jgi:hypothetical protein
MLDESLQFLILLDRANRTFLDMLPPEDKHWGRAFPMYVAQACSLALAVRKLTVSGLEIAAEAVVRSFLEALDLSMVVLCDKDFAESVTDLSDTYDEAQFWKQHVGGGKLRGRLARVLDGLGIEQVHKADLFRTRDYQKQSFSGAVHSSAPSVLRSFLVPVLRKPGVWSMRTLGDVSVNAPSLLSTVITETHQFGVVLMHAVWSDNVPRLFRDAHDDQKWMSAVVAFFTLQELIEQYDEILPPPHPFDSLTDDELRGEAES